MRTILGLTWIFLVSEISAWAQLPKQITPEQCMKPFYHGVASGDPLHDRVIIWTRVTPSSPNQQPVAVSWKMAKDTAMSVVVQSGSLITTAERDYTVKIDVTNLEPDTWYYYEFLSGGKRSIQGRTRTTPLPSVLKDSLRFAVVSCANLEAGFFNAYASLAERKDFDAVLCLGDYYYEYETGGYAPNPQTDRFFEPNNETITLEDYRMRHSIYRLDPDLRKLHQLFPWFCIWDDHEFANDAWTGGAENHSTSEGNWTTRKGVSKQAYFEWIPIRDNNAQGMFEIYRNVSYGKLADLILLDTRIKGRNQQVAVTSSQLNSASRTLLGTDQFDWLIRQLNNSQAKYKILAQQVMVAPLQVFGVAVNMDQWDGYPAERSRLLNHIVAENIKNVVVLTGDIHTSWAMNLPAINGNAGIEFVTPSITSPALEALEAISYVGEAAIKAANSHIKWVDLTKHGYMIVDYNQNRVQSDWYFVNTINASETSYSWGASYYANQGISEIFPTSTVSLPRNDLFHTVPLPCPRPVIPVDEEEPENTASVDETDQIVVLGIYPNPAKSHLNVHFSNMVQDEVSMMVSDLSGKMLKEEQFMCKEGSWNYVLDTEMLSPGIYTLFIRVSGHIIRRNFVKE